MNNIVFDKIKGLLHGSLVYGANSRLINRFYIVFIKIYK